MFQFIGRLAQNFQFWSSLMNLIHNIGSRADFGKALRIADRAVADGKITEIEWGELGRALGIFK